MVVDDHGWLLNSIMPILFIAYIPSFSISWTFSLGMWTITKFKLYYKVSYVLVATVVTRLKFTFKNFIRFYQRSENFVSMLCFLSSLACSNCFGKSEVTFSRKPFMKGVISGTTYNHIDDSRVLEVIKFIFGTYVF